MTKKGDKINDFYSRFRDWQKEPFRYENKSTGLNICANCGTEFSDNFCPRCGQQANVRRITWKSVRQNVMNLWGLGSRSFLYTLLQLLLRPGYLIRDYLSGKRQVSFPPVNMLFIVAVIYLFIERIINPAPPNNSAKDLVAFGMFVDLLYNNPAWAFVLLSPLLIFPVWLIFRFAPGYSHHTLPEGFFIQVYMSILIIVINIICDLIWIWLGWSVFVYFFITYKQLFGYGWWGTIWRTAFCFAFFVAAGVVVLATSELAVTREAIGESGIAGDIAIILRFILFAAIPVIAGYFISKGTVKTFFQSLRKRFGFH